MNDDEHGGEVLAPPPDQTTPEDHVDYAGEQLGAPTEWLAELPAEGPALPGPEVED